MTVTKKKKVLWIDDELPGFDGETAGYTIKPIRTLNEAETFLASGVKPDFVVVDVLVPQDGWRSDYLELPGLHFIKHLEERGYQASELAGYSIVSDQVKEKINELGVTTKVFTKSSSSFLEVIDYLDRMIEK